MTHHGSFGPGAELFHKSDLTNFMGRGLIGYDGSTCFKSSQCKALLLDDAASHDHLCHLNPIIPKIGTNSSKPKRIDAIAICDA